MRAVRHALLLAGALGLASAAPRRLRASCSDGGPFVCPSQPTGVCPNNRVKPKTTSCAELASSKYCDVSFKTLYGAETLSNVPHMTAMVHDACPSACKKCKARPASCGIGGMWAKGRCTCSTGLKNGTHVCSWKTNYAGPRWPNATLKAFCTLKTCSKRATAETSGNSSACGQGRGYWDTQLGECMCRHTMDPKTHVQKECYRTDMSSASNRKSNGNCCKKYCEIALCNFQRNSGGKVTGVDKVADQDRQDVVTSSAEEEFMDKYWLYCLLLAIIVFLMMVIASRKMYLHHKLSIQIDETEVSDGKGGTAEMLHIHVNLDGNDGVERTVKVNVRRDKKLTHEYVTEKICKALKLKMDQIGGMCYEDSEGAEAQFDDDSDLECACACCEKCQKAGCTECHCDKELKLKVQLADLVE